MPDAGAKAVPFQEPLFASVAHAHSRRAPDRARTLWVMPLALGFHALVLLGVTTVWHAGDRDTPATASDRGDLVLRLLAAPPPPPPPAATSSPGTVPRKTVARRARPFPKPTLAPRPLPAALEPATLPSEAELEAEQAPPGTAGGALASDSEGVAGGLAGGITGGVVGGVVQQVLGASNVGLLLAPPPPRPTEEQLTTWREHYFETMFRDRFENVRYPHQAAMAGIEGKLVIQISVGSRGQLLGLKVHGYCPHYVLCDAALQAVRDAAPFPPPPPELGGRVTVELPFNFFLR
ncbi:TonB family protein [Pyxidicoccus xibeiensis]|uniref:TonB family protein n=1 Tax=Pyxidicoccus xibeiensis TaxID=2906759 RepID=UPI0020A7C35D|nr:TonB family protein [Pyxidicoccus xibeiensis]MCP3136285.1 TonB family protein [Pyxidicoccus xibeiensis]